MMEKTLFIHLYTAFNFNNESVWMINMWQLEMNTALIY